ncbi:uncharacterized protein CXQ87_004696 [Candidozyma duobushaemuli]|uniref:Major facilitator superfamily (MFS) profile domain-containing protein n=2 Tax=Candidozyma TaxID=3303203 RepID=A0ABX8IH33_9ASCO|nr:uncharacterized protein CXQ87_004696 [[Candida] duobushaemulonis]PVH16405.1 hypothetical protein CXQ87_004696 [[Candida] duobushaemulonis]QWU90176.1 hypothetical protein CA3LBN_004537 [[Candida] haemuloni]
MGLEDNRLVQRFINVGEKKAGSTSMGIIVGVFAAFGGVLYGYDTGTINGIMAMDYVKNQFPGSDNEFTASETSLIVSILSVGTFFGSLAAPFFSDTLGRKWCLILSSLVVFNIGVILQTAATGIPLLCAGRAIAGAGVGLISSTIPLYQSEAAPKWIRGAIVSCYQWAITIGIFLAAVFNQATHARNDSGSYRIPIALQFLWSLILGIGMFFLPETPRFYVSKEREDKAFEALSQLRKLPADHPDLIEEYNDIKAAYEFEKEYGKSSWGQVLSSKNHQRKRLATGVLCQAFQQLTGVNFIFYFGTNFFNDAGVDGFVTTLATNIVNVGATVPGILLMEIAGRRNILLGGAAGMSISQFVVAIVGVAASSDSSKKVLVAFSCIFIAFFAATWGPCAWVVVGELFPLRTRAKSVALCTASNWLWNWGIAYATPYMVDKDKGNLGTNVFFIWGGCNFLCFFFAWYSIYETKGLSLEQIDELYEKVPHAWRSQGFVPSEHAFRDDALTDLRSDTKAEAISIEERSV